MQTIPLGMSGEDYEELNRYGDDVANVPMRYLGDFATLDRVVAKLILRAELSVMPTTKEHKSFLDRKVEEGSHIMRADYPDVASFLNAYRQKQAAEKEVDRESHKGTNLPMIYYFRKPGYGSADIAEDGKNEFGHRFLSDTDEAIDNGVPEGQSVLVNFFPNLVTYEMVFITRDLHTVDAMELAWQTFIGEKTNEMVTVEVIVDSVKLRSMANVKTPQTASFIDNSVDAATSGRIYAVSTTVDVATKSVAMKRVGNVDVDLALNRPKEIT